MRWGNSVEEKYLFNKYVGTTRYLYLEKRIQLDPYFLYICKFRVNYRSKCEKPKCKHT